MTNKTTLRVYAPNWNTNFIDELPLYQRNDVEAGEAVRPAVIIPLPYTKKINKKAGAK